MYLTLVPHSELVNGLQVSSLQANTQDRQADRIRTNETLRRVRVSTVRVKKELLYILSFCL